MREKIEKVIKELKKAKKVTVLTGAGISKESGVPTFRGKEGLWQNYKPEELATPYAFSRDPKKVWEWYDWRRQMLYDKLPNKAHIALVKIEKFVPNFTLITQNVDGLHHKAGSKNVLELHGCIWRMKCWNQCGVPPWEDRTVPLPELPPKCPSCGGIARPDTVWFGEQIPEDVLEASLNALNCDFMFVIGTSGVVQPAASFAYHAKTRGAFLVEVNVEPTPLTSMMDVSLMGKATEIMESIVSGL